MLIYLLTIFIQGIVYNVTRYVDFHPGGKSELMKGVGKDATKLFDDVKYPNLIIDMKKKKFHSVYTTV